MDFSSASATADTGGIVGWVTAVMEALGAPGVGIAIASENLFPRSRAR